MLLEESLTDLIEQAKCYGAAALAVPAKNTIKEADPARAREIQKWVSDEFLGQLSNNLAVTQFERTAEAGTYLLSSWPSK